MAQRRISLPKRMTTDDTASTRQGPNCRRLIPTEDDAVPRKKHKRRESKGLRRRNAPILSKKPPVLFLDSHQAAAFLRLSPRTLEKHRVVGGGPRFIKFGRRVVYKISELEEWAAAHTCCSTSDAIYNGLH